MAEYIEREVAIESFRKNIDGGYVLTNDAQTTHILQSIPAADVREVVLCRDCKFLWNTANDGEDPPWYLCDNSECCETVTLDGYCAWGVKREG